MSGAYSERMRRERGSNRGTKETAHEAAQEREQGRKGGAVSGVPPAPHRTGKAVGFVLRVTLSVTNRHTSPTPHPTGGAWAVCHYRHSVGATDSPAVVGGI